MDVDVNLIRSLIEDIKNDRIKSVTIRKRKNEIVICETKEKTILSVPVSGQS